MMLPLVGMSEKTLVMPVPVDLGRNSQFSSVRDLVPLSSSFSVVVMVFTGAMT